MFGKPLYDSLQKAKGMLATDDVEGCISTLLPLFQRLQDEANTPTELKGKGGKDIEHQLIAYSASLSRAQQAFQVGLINYDKHSAERTRIIKGILSNLFGYVQSGKGMFSDPNKAEMVYSVHIENEQLLAEQLGQLAENLENSKREVG